MGVALVIAALVLQATTLEAGRGDAGALIEAERSGARVLIFTAMQTVGFCLFAPLLLVLFTGARSRSERVVSALIGLVGIGPVFLGVGILVSNIGVVDAASDFVARDGAVNAAGQRLADRLLEDASLRPVGQALTLAGLFAMGGGLLYTCLWAMRTGLLTRFWGTLGMAVGVVSVLGFIPGLLLFMVAMGFQMIGVWFEPRPPAWEAGAEIPWPKPAPRDEAESDPGGEPEPDAPPPVEPGDTPEPPVEPSRRKRKQRD